jgi:hypothetical protein
MAKDSSLSMASGRDVSMPESAPITELRVKNPL